MKGKVCLVTGANAGIGLATATGLAERGATVVLLCRNRERGEAARERIEQRTGNPNLDLLLCDLASQASIREAVESFTLRYERLDVLINNAGVATRDRQVTVDGFELTFAVDYLGPFLLTNLLLGTLQASAPARVVNLAGAFHKKGRIRFDDLQFERGFDAMAANNQAQLARVLFTYELARRLDGTGVTANCLHPGAVRTGAQRVLPWAARLLIATLLRPVFVSPERGADTSLYLATSPEVEGITGRFFVRKQPVASSDASYDPTLARRLWRASESLVGQEFDRPSCAEPHRDAGTPGAEERRR